jgi:peptide/nickel transport system permease protein
MTEALHGARFEPASEAGAEIPPEGAVVTAAAARRMSWRELRSSLNRLVVGAAILAAVLLLAALLAPLLAPFDPDQQKLLARLRPPIGFTRADAHYLLGTDQLGRDMLSRCIYGLRLTLALAFFGTLVGLLAGVGIGLLAGLAGGIVEDLLMGLVDVMLSLPFVLVALLVIAIAGTDLMVLVAVLGMAYWAHFARLIRAQVISLRDLPYIEAARASGALGWRVATRHMIPNMISPIVVMATLNFSNLILLESSLSFIGLGVQPPTATLGSMVGQGRDYMASYPWVVASPAIFIVLVSLAVMLLGDFMRDRFDVRLRDR